jgi:hypothetical protein
MLPTDKSELLKSFLGELPKEAAFRLAAAVERDRLADGSALPHDVILEGLRPILISAGKRGRTPTPLRLFCQPFEDLLVNLPRKEKQKGRILRSHVIPIWLWLIRSVIPAEAGAYSKDVRKAVLGRRFDEALVRATVFWPLAGEAMSAALAGDRKAVQARLRNDAALADVDDIVPVLKVGASMLEVQALLPKPTPVLSEDLLWGLRCIYDHVIEVQADAAPFVAVVAMRRLAKPWEALKLPLMVARQTQDTLIASTDMGLAGDVLLADMEDARSFLVSLRHPAFDPAALIAHLAAFTDISSAIVKEVEILRRGRWGQRLLSDRAEVGAVMDEFMERVPKEIAGALPSHKTGYGGGPRVPDFDRPPDPERVDRALRYAKVLSGTKLYAVPGSFGAKHQDAIDEASLILRSYNEDLLKELCTAQGERRAVVERQYRLALELTQLVFDEGEADFLRRRGKAATQTAAA